MTTKKLSYNLEVLNGIVNRDKCTLKQEYKKVTANMKIIFICGEPECSNEHSKMMQNFVVTGGYCKKCTSKRKFEKIKATNIQRYGCENVFQNEQIKEKIVATNIEKYGVPAATQCESVKEKYKQTMLDKYGVENSFQAEEVKQKIKETMMAKYDCENPQQYPEIQRKTIQTNQEKYGVSNPMQNVDIREKAKSTNMIKYGCENPFQSEVCKEKSKQTCLAKYGVEYSMQSIQTKEKSCATNMERYGVPNPSQCPDILDKQFKNACRLKDFVFPCGKVIQVQGYEPLALDELIKIGYTSLDIVTNRNEVPEIWYEKHGKQKRYFCDIFIPKENKIIEVKSDYTYQHKSGNVQEKARASVELNFLYEFWIYDGNGKKEVILHNKS